MSRALDESVTLDDITAIVAQKRVPLAPELAGYLALEIAEQCTKDASEVDPKQVYVSEEGSVAVVRSRKIAPEGGAEASIRALLGKLLDAAGSQTPALTAAARRKSGSGVATLVEDLEGALIPVNRAAGRRALARLAREVKRVLLGVGRNASVSQSERRASSPAIKIESPQRPPTAPVAFEQEESPTTARREIPPEVLENASSPSLQRPASDQLPTVGLTPAQLEAANKGSTRDSVDSLLDKFEVSETREDKAVSRDLKAIAGLDPTPPPPNASQADREIDALLADVPPSKPIVPTRDEIKRRRPSRADTKTKQPSIADDRQLPTEPTKIKRPHSMTNESKRARGPSNLVFVVLGLVFLIAGAGALWMLKPGFFTGRTPEKLQEEKLQEEKEQRRIAALNAIPQCRTSLVVSDAPEESEILVRVGQAPADIANLPVGVRLEFVAMAEGFVPKRAVIPLGTAWDPSGPNGKPRFELAVQLDKSKLKPGQLDPWPTPEPGATDVGGKGVGPPGVVHAISTPKGAEIWLLAGLGPSSSVDDLIACDADVDLLVVGAKSFRRRIRVTAAEFVPNATKPGWRIARTSLGIKPK